MAEFDMSDIKPNSHRYKERMQKEEQLQNQEKKIEKVASGKIKKKSGMSKFADTFMAEDRRNVKSYILNDVVLPWVKDLIYTVVANSLSMSLFGDTNHTNKQTKNTAYRYSYGSCFGSSKLPQTNRVQNTSYSYDDILFETRGDAEMVLSGLDDILERYGMASVADFYELADITGKYTDYNYGWKNLQTAEILRVSSGYMIKFPRPVPLKD